MQWKIHQAVIKIYESRNFADSFKLIFFFKVHMLCLLEIKFLCFYWESVFEFYTRWRSVQLSVSLEGQTNLNTSKMFIYTAHLFYEAYSKSKYRLRIFPPQRWDREFAQARCLPSFIAKPQTPIREKQIVFTYCLVCLKCSRWGAPRRL